MIRIMIIGTLLLGLCLITNEVNKEYYSQDSSVITEKPPFLLNDDYWVDSVMNTLSLEEKIGQLLMYPAYSNKDEKHVKEIEYLIENYKIGGLIFMQGDPISQVELINNYQQKSKIPLLIAMDAEWSLSMRLKNTILYPRQMMLGAIRDNQLIYEMGSEFARQLKRTGVHVNFAPVIDVNNNSFNPVINCRSFGEDKYNVAEKSYYYMKGMQDNGILAVGKHFPGHGDTDTDSHYFLPKINHDRYRLDSIELVPFKYLIKRGLGGIMTAHLFVPSIDSTINMPASLTKKAVENILIDELGFEGLIFTDALNMGGVTNHYKPGKSDVLALIAGNDILLFPNDAETVVDEIKKAIEDGLISIEAIEHRCKKILKAKYWAGLAEPPHICKENLIADLNNDQAGYMQQKLIENALTLAKNDNDIIPIKNLDSIKIALITFGNATKNDFQNRADNYASIDHYIYNIDFSNYGRIGLLNKLKDYDLVIASVHNTNRNPSRKFGIPSATINFIDELADQSNMILVLFANPYSIDYFMNIDKINSVLVAYNDWKITNDFAAQLIFGGIPAKGVLPVSPNKDFPAGTGFETKKIRLKFSKYPEDARVDASLIYKIDSLVEDGLVQKAYPGAHVMAIRNGVVFYNKTAGYHTDQKDNEVDEYDIFDLASLTKILATTLSLMKEYDNISFKLDDKLADYIPELRNTNKKNITYREALIHQGGLIAWIPFFRNTVLNDSVFNSIYSPMRIPGFEIQVAENLYMNNSYIDTIYKRLYDSNLRASKKYLYSDLGFYFLRDALENITDREIDSYIKEEFYNSIGAWSLTYNPLNHFDKTNIVPTEIDNYFRHQLLHGYVHDQGTAMLGGIAGHAGLFGNAGDVAKIMQMILQNGEYGDKQYFSDETVKLFTSYNNRCRSRRGLGFDKPDPRNRDNAVGGIYASEKAFGHLGFTGTMAWADPEYSLVFVFLSNRIYPDSDNRKLQKMRIRGNILDVLYKAIINYDLMNLE